MLTRTYLWIVQSQKIFLRRAFFLLRNTVDRRRSSHWLLFTSTNQEQVGGQSYGLQLSGQLHGTRCSKIGALTRPIIHRLGKCLFRILQILL
jgi:hypothetical protein